MKTPKFLFSVMAVGILFLSGASPLAIGGTKGKALSAAAGKYKGKARGQLSSEFAGIFTPLKKTGAFVKLPRGKGRFLANFGGVKIKGRVTRVSVRQGGSKVSFTASGILPAVVTDLLAAGPGTGSFRGDVNLTGKKSKLSGKGTFGVPGLISLNARFKGEKS